jgi:hypothetical protein
LRVDRRVRSRRQIAILAFRSATAGAASRDQSAAGPSAGVADGRGLGVRPPEWVPRPGRTVVRRPDRRAVSSSFWPNYAAPVHACTARRGLMTPEVTVTTSSPIVLAAGEGRPRSYASWPKRKHDSQDPVLAVIGIRSPPKRQVSGAVGWPRCGGRCRLLWGGGSRHCGRRE